MFNTQLLDDMLIQGITIRTMYVVLVMCTPYELAGERNKHR